MPAPSASAHLDRVSCSAQPRRDPEFRAKFSILDMTPFRRSQRHRQIQLPDKSSAKNMKPRKRPSAGATRANPVPKVETRESKQRTVDRFARRCGWHLMDTGIRGGSAYTYSHEGLLFFIAKAPHAGSRPPTSLDEKCHLVCVDGQKENEKNYALESIGEAVKLARKLGGFSQPKKDMVTSLAHKHGWHLQQMSLPGMHNSSLGKIVEPFAFSIARTLPFHCSYAPIDPKAPCVLMIARLSGVGDAICVRLPSVKAAMDISKGVTEETTEQP
jgi:hypothetical protein